MIATPEDLHTTSAERFAQRILSDEMIYQANP
jgi:hypothetical protein